MECDIAVVGGGVLGVTTTFWLSELYDCSVLLLEREKDVALHTTLRNTGLVHRPYYLDPVKKRLFALSAEKSYHLWKKLAASRRLPWEEVGTLMVADDERGVSTLGRYERWGVENGMVETEYELLDGQAVAKAEPEVRCKGAILSKRDTSTDYAALTRAVWGLASENGAKLLPAADVKSVKESEGKVSATLADGREVTCSFLVNAAGGRSLDIAHGMGLGKEYTDLHFRGEYWQVDPTLAPRVARSVYSVARHEGFPFLDPHFIIRANGRKEVGPNAVLVSGPEAYEGGGGAWGLVSKLLERPMGPKARLFTNAEFLSVVWGEWRSSLFKGAMCARVRRFIPSLTPGMLSTRGLAGVRSSLIGREGFVPEALVMAGANSLHVLNYNSPGATGAPVFSAHVVRRMENGGHLDRFRAKPRRTTMWDYDATQIVGV